MTHVSGATLHPAIKKDLSNAAYNLRDKSISAMKVNLHGITYVHCL